MYCCIRDSWSPINLVASTVAELDDIPLHFTDDIGIVFGPLTDYPSMFLCARRHKGTVGLAELFDSPRGRWSLMLPLWLMCVVLPGGYLARLFYIDLNLRDTLRYE
jgi:hypothetical protein